MKHNTPPTIPLFRTANGRPLQRLHIVPLDTLKRGFLLRGQKWQV
jgi:hypothetical protein